MGRRITGRRMKNGPSRNIAAGASFFLDIKHPAKTFGASRDTDHDSQIASLLTANSCGARVDLNRSHVAAGSS